MQMHGARGAHFVTKSGTTSKIASRGKESMLPMMRVLLLKMREEPCHTSCSKQVVQQSDGEWPDRIWDCN